MMGTAVTNPQEKVVSDAKDCGSTLSVNCFEQYVVWGSSQSNCSFCCGISLQKSDRWAKEKMKESTQNKPQ